MGKGTQITGGIEQKIYNLACDFLDERTEKNRKTLSEDELKDPFAGVESAKNLTISQVLIYIQLRDFELKRTKKAQLEKSISKVLKLIREDEENELNSNELEKDLDTASEAEAVDATGSNLMEFKDPNLTNKAVTSLWNFDDKDNEQNLNADDGSNTKRKAKDSAKNVSKKQKRRFDHTPPEISFLNLGGLDNVTTQLLELIGLPILHPEIYTSTGVEPPRGVLLYGPPGCGKTTIANALAGELKVPFINISAPSIVSGMSGESEKKLRELFEEAKSVAPCLIFMDEIDAITPKRDGGAQREMERRIVAQLLTLMDELTLDKTGNKPVIVIGATNRPDSLDSALRRAGRFDREICLNVPNEAQRESILRAMTKNIQLQEGENFGYRELSKLTPGYVGADLKSLVTAAGVTAIKRIFEIMSEKQEDDNDVHEDNM